MTIIASGRSISAFLGLLVTLVLAGGLRSTAQQNDRQLNREQSQATRTNERRLALVIGNGAYTNAPPLKNPPNDARDMATTLKELGFEVTSGINVNQREMKNLIRDFGQKLKAGGSGLFYYAGHGVQSKGRNYLIPIEADIQSEVEVEDAGVDVNLVLGYMDDAQNGLNIVILDACRNNPFGRSFRSADSGLAAVDAPTGTLIAYATAPGRVASDGTGQNGLYTSELLKQMRVPGLSATDLFMHVRAEVMKQTANKQVPWEASSLVGAFYFAGGKAANPSLPNDSSRISDSAREQALWDAVKESTDPRDLRDYLARYPNGAYVAAANVKLRRIETAKSSTPADSQTSNTEPTNSGGNKTSESADSLLGTVWKGSVSGKFEADGTQNKKASRETMKFQFLPEGRFVLNVSYGSSSFGSPIEGTWKQTGNTVHMRYFQVGSTSCAFEDTGEVSNGQIVGRTTYSNCGFGGHAEWRMQLTK